VYVDSVTLLLKLVFHKCHVNKFNLYNQVGLIAVNCMGEMHNALQSTGGSPQRTSQLYASVGGGGGSMGVPNLEEELSIDKSTMETLKALYAAKERAVSMEEFDEAKRLKDTIDRLKMISGHMSQLEERKKMAI
jgi:centrosomal protein CEP104